MELVLVVGSNGWLASRLVSMLKKRNKKVTIRGFDIQPPREGVPVDDFVQGDLGNINDVRRAMIGVDTVFHVVALVVGSVEKLKRVNVTGVENVIAVCNENRVKRLVYTSSASVVFDGVDICDGTEDMPYQTKNLDIYSITKAKAEQMVLKANSSKLSTCALRPHSIYGPGDPESFPRIIQSAREGKLKWNWAEDKYFSSYTYIDNICHAEILAADRLVEDPETVGGNAYNINDGVQGKFWTNLCKVASLSGVPSSTYRRYKIPFILLYAIAWLVGKCGLPLTFTPYVLLIATTTHTYSIEKAKRHLGYKPVMDPDKSWNLTLESFKEYLEKNPPKPTFYLSYWLTFVACLSIFGAAQAFYHTHTLQTKQFSLKPEQVTPLAAKLFGAWTLITSIVRIRCAYNLDNKVLYSTTLLTFWIALGIYGWEFFVAESIPLIPFLGPCIIACTSIIWMFFFPPKQ